MKLLTVIGARPQFVKAATVSRIIADYGVQETIVHTGQHYDAALSDSFFEELDIPNPTFNLEVGSGSHGYQTGQIMERLENVIMDIKPDKLLVYGDTNSTLAAALVAAKHPISLAHVEAGLRSYRPGMPEEVNRIVTDRLSSELFCPTASSVNNLLKEGRVDGVYLVGDIMFDGFLYYKKMLDTGDVYDRYSVEPSNFILATIHRAENTNNIQHLCSIISALNKICKNQQIVFPVHPRTRKLLDSKEIDIDKGLKLIDPVSYKDMLSLLLGSSTVVTDSGGLQKEAYFAQVPCVTIRDETEWVETLEYGWNRLSEPYQANIVNSVEQAVSLNTSLSHPNYYGDGDAAHKIIQIIENNS